MFEAVRNNKRVAQVILAVLIVPFAFFGMDAYFSDGPGRNDVATVGKTSISVNEFEQALRDQQDRLRSSMDGQVDRALLESEALRRSVLDNLVNRRVLALYAQENRFSVTAQELQETIAAVPSFHDNGQFSLQRYENLLRAQGMSPAMFEARLAQDIQVQQLALPLGEAAFAPGASAQRFIVAQMEERTVREMRLAAASFAAEAKISDADIAAYYEANPVQFERPARVQAEYVVFDRSAAETGIEVSEDQIRAFYEGNPGRFGVPEERRARHILLALDAGADAATVDKVMAEANALADQLRADPSRFATVAREQSRDPGSAANGGDLGFFARGAMVGAFEDAAFALGKDEISAPVRSDFGVHIIQVTDIKPAATRSLAEAHDEIAAELRGQEAGRRYAEMAEQFANMVYEQADSLAPVAEALHLQVHETGWLEREGGMIGPYTSEPLLAALFSDDAVRNHRNTEAVEVAQGTLAAARVKEFEAAQRLPLDQVRDRIGEQLRREAGGRAAAERGAAVLAELEQGKEAAANWGEARTLQRAAPALPAEAMQAVFAAPTAKLPAHVGVREANGDYVLFRIDAVERPQVAADDPRMAAVSAQYAQLLAERDFGAFITELRKRYKVELKLPALAARD